MNQPAKKDTITWLIAQEHALADPQCRQNEQQLDALLSDDFSEFGRSGKRYDKTSIMQALLAVTEHDYHYEIVDISAHWLGDGCVMLTYRSILNQQEHAWRTSIWCREGGRWRIRHHQGTATQ